MYSGPQRKHLRLKDYDSSQAGIYFLTFCTYKKQCFFGEIIDGEMMLNDYGKRVEKCWFEIPEHFDNVELDGFVIMPNHVHGVIKIQGQNTVGTEYILSLQKTDLSNVIKGMKIGVTRFIRENLMTMNSNGKGHFMML